MTDIEARVAALEHLMGVTIKEVAPPAVIQHTIDRLVAQQAQNAGPMLIGYAPVSPPAMIEAVLAIFRRAQQVGTFSNPAGNA